MPHHKIMLPLKILCLFAAHFFFATTLMAADTTPAGSVKNVTGEAQVARAGVAPVALKPGDRIFEQDILTTGKGASLGLVLRDNSTLSIGPASKLIVERFLFAPEKGALSSLLRVSGGSLACVSGEITKLSPDAMKVTTPTASIGIRGTHFLVNVEDGPENTEVR